MFCFSPNKMPITAGGISSLWLGQVLPVDLIPFLLQSTTQTSWGGASLDPVGSPLFWRRRRGKRGGRYGPTSIHTERCAPSTTCSSRCGRLSDRWRSSRMTAGRQRRCRSSLLCLCCSSTSLLGWGCSPVGWIWGLGRAYDVGFHSRPPQRVLLPELTFRADSLTVSAQQSHASTSMHTLKIPSTGSCPVVWYMKMQCTLGSLSGRETENGHVHILSPEGGCPASINTKRGMWKKCPL